MTFFDTQRPTAARLLGGLVVAVILASAGFAPPADARPDKVEVCHFDSEQSTWELLRISSRALEAHLRIGDVLPGDDIASMPGFTMSESCTPTQVEFALTADRVYQNGGAYLNDNVRDAIDRGSYGTATVTEGDGVTTFEFSFGNLLPNTLHTVYLDASGGAPGPWSSVGDFMSDADGNASFGYSVATPAPAAWGFWINIDPVGSILQTVTDVPVG